MRAQPRTPRLTGDAALLGAAVAGALDRAGVRELDEAVRAGVVRAECLAALLGAAVTGALDRAGVLHLGEAIGAGVVGAEGLATLVDGALAGALGQPGLWDGGEAVRAADGVTVQRLHGGGGRMRGDKLSCTSDRSLQGYGKRDTNGAVDHQVAVR